MKVKNNGGTYRYRMIWVWMPGEVKDVPPEVAQAVLQSPQMEAIAGESHAVEVDPLGAHDRMQRTGEHRHYWRVDGTCKCGASKF